MKTSHKLVELDWIRGLSALLIMLYHYTYRYNDIVSPVHDWHIKVIWGNAAVNVFFLLSGFLTAYTMSDRLSPSIYLRKRALRLYPTYWTCLIVTSIIVYLYFPSLSLSLKHILINLTMFQGFLGVPNVDGVYWTLKCEIHFYLFVFLFLLLFKGNNIK